MHRRKFIGQSVSGVALSLTGIPGMLSASSLQGSRDQASLFIGTPVLPEILYERGIPETLDTMKELAGITTVMTFSHDFQFRQYRHGYGHKTDKEGKPLTNIWVRTHPEFYENPAFAERDLSLKYAERDILDELWEAARPRQMDVYARILEPYVITGAIGGFEEFAEVDAMGREGKNVCFNHPGYMGYWDSVVEDLVRSHPFLKGFKYGQERGGPLLTALGGSTATCFCDHCRVLAAEREIHVERARLGMLALQQFGNRLRENGPEPVDGRMVSFLRILSEYPDLLAWEKLWMDSREAQKQRMYTLIKSIRPSMEVGWHMDHGMTWDLVTRAFWDYGKMGPYSDWLSVALYFDSMGRRSLNHYNKFYRHILLGDAAPEISYPMYLSMLGYPPENQPALEQHEKSDTAFSADYVYRECRRAVQAVNGGAGVYARPGFDMPGYECDVQPEQVYDAVKAALRAGVDGLWCGREWDELREKNIRAFGNAVRDHLSSL